MLEARSAVIATPPRAAELPTWCVAARDGDVAALAALRKAGDWEPLHPRCRDKHGTQGRVKNVSRGVSGSLFLSSRESTRSLSFEREREREKKNLLILSRRAGYRAHHWAAGSSKGCLEYCLGQAHSRRGVTLFLSLSLSLSRARRRR